MIVRFLVAALGVLWLTTSPALPATVEGSVSIAGLSAAKTVVYLDGGSNPPVAPPPHVLMDQKNLAFVPSVLPVVRGTVIEFSNSDDVSHNVFSPSANAGKFTLGTYGPGATRTVTLNEPGDVRVLCNIHMEMEAHILVLENPYFSMVGEDGRYRIPDVSAGTYTMKVWNGRWLQSTQRVEVPASGSVRVDLKPPT